MMKKIFLIVFLVVSIFFYGVQTANAQGTFSCVWNISTQKCEVKPDEVGFRYALCDADYAPDPAFCSKFGYGDCVNQRNAPCKLNPTIATIRCGNSENIGINTAIGCIPIENANVLISFILKWALGIAGGIAFLLILFAGFQIITSRGDPNRLKAGQELLTSAIAGLVLLIFSIFILRIIGFNILNITAFQ